MKEGDSTRLSSSSHQAFHVFSFAFVLFCALQHFWLFIASHPLTYWCTHPNICFTYFLLVHSFNKFSWVFNRLFLEYPFFVPTTGPGCNKQGLVRDSRKARGRELTADSLDWRRAVGRQGLCALLADALLPVEGHPVTGREGLSANKHKATSQCSAFGSSPAHNQQVCFNKVPCPNKHHFTEHRNDPIKHCTTFPGFYTEKSMTSPLSFGNKRTIQS